MWLAECAVEVELECRRQVLGWRDHPVCPAPQGAFGAGGTPQSCPQLRMSILSSQSFFEGWDASKKKDKTKGRQDHMSTCECL